MVAAETHVETAAWRLHMPSVPDVGRTVCIPTIHPIGDQRVLRCAQAVLDAGYSVHFVWLGAAPGEARHHARISETRLPKARSFRDRIRAIPAVVKRARSVDADMWHIHDFYLLPFAWAWSRRTGRAAIYDVHEYYPEYYSRKMAGPRWLQLALERLLTAVERHFSSKFGGVNAVSDALAERFCSAGVPAVSTPNYPAAEAFREAARSLTPPLLRRVVHTGTLSVEAGSEVLVEIARELERTAPDVEIILISRFHSDNARSLFMASLERGGKPRNLTMIDPIPAHEIAGLLANCGIGLSALQDCGQNPLAVATKLYEYATTGLAIVASDLPATRHFMSKAVGSLVAPDRAKDYAEAIVRLMGDAEATCDAVNLSATIALNEMSWENVCAPRLQSLIRIADRSFSR